MRNANLSKFLSILNINRVKWSFFYFIWVFVLFPGNIEFNQLIIRQECFKSKLGLFVSNGDFSVVLSKTLMKGFSVSSDAKNFINEQSSEFIRSFIEFLSLQQFDSIEIRNNGTQKSARTDLLDHLDSISLLSACACR